MASPIQVLAILNDDALGRTTQANRLMELLGIPHVQALGFRDGFKQEAFERDFEPKESYDKGRNRGYEFWLKYVNSNDGADTTS